MKLFYSFLIVIGVCAVLFFPAMQLLDNVLLSNGIVVRSIHIFASLKLESFFNFSNRFDSFYVTSISFVFLKPLFGHGIGMDQINICETIKGHLCTIQEAQGYYTHNIFIELFHEFGILFGLILSLLIIYIMYGLIKHKKVLAIPLLFVGFFPLMLSGTWYSSLSFWLLIGYYYLMIREEQNSYIEIIFNDLKSIKRGALKFIKIKGNN